MDTRLSVLGYQCDARVNATYLIPASGMGHARQSRKQKVDRMEGSRTRGVLYITASG